MNAVDRTLSIGDRASELMRAYSRSATPRCYELWYTYVTGLIPDLNEAVKRLVVGQGRLSPDDVDDIWSAYVSTDRLSAASDRTGGGLLIEIDQVMSLIEAAVGSTASYGASLATLSDDLSNTGERHRARDIVQALVQATRDVAASNRTLETKLRSSHGEIRALMQALDDVRAETLVDPLTGIANRKHFETVLATSVPRAHRTAEPLMLVVIDIDDFKRFNDSYGHLTGDQVLRLVSAAMRENVGGESTLARFGGEEFAILLPSASPSATLACAETIRRNVMGRELLKRSTGESLGRVTISLGVASLLPGDTPATFLDRADTCMYRAKRTGRNRSVCDWDSEPSKASAA